MSAMATMEDFEAMLAESFEHDTPEEGSVVKGTVIAVENGQAIIDVGFKVEGRVELKEFAAPGQAPEIAVGDEVEVYLERVENAKGEAMISRDKARREEAWDRLEKANDKQERVEGAIFGRVKGGFTVDLDGAGSGTIATGIGMFDHLLTALAHHSLIDIELTTEGDLHVDDHHTVEDVGICLGDALVQVLQTPAPFLAVADLDRNLGRGAVRDARRDGRHAG